MDKEVLLNQLAEFFLDSLREDAADVDNWCIQGENAIDDFVAAIALHTSKTV